MRWIKCLCNLALALFALPAASLYAQVPFYQGKTITVIVSSDTGGTSDLRVKSLVPYLQKYIPGNPTVVVDYMPGGGGRKAANHVFRSARPDGLIIGSMGTTLLAAAIQGESGVLYDLNKFIYLGSSDAATQHIFSTRKEIGLTNLDKLRGASGLRIGAQSVGHNIHITGRLFAFFLALKDPRMVVGYSGPEVDLALLRGEVDARSRIPRKFSQARRRRSHTAHARRASKSHPGSPPRRRGHRPLQQDRGRRTIAGSLIRIVAIRGYLKLLPG